MTLSHCSLLCCLALLCPRSSTVPARAPSVFSFVFPPLPSQLLPPSYWLPLLAFGSFYPLFSIGRPPPCFLPCAPHPRGLSMHVQHCGIQNVSGVQKSLVSLLPLVDLRPPPLYRFIASHPAFPSPLVVPLLVVVSLTPFVEQPLCGTTRCPPSLPSPSPPGGATRYVVAQSHPSPSLPPSPRGRWGPLKFASARPRLPSPRLPCCRARRPWALPVAVSSVDAIVNLVVVKVSITSSKCLMQ